MKFKWTLVLTILTPFLIYFSIMLIGGGHGTPVPLMSFFPSFFLFDAYSDDGGLTLWILIPLLQLPIYGLIIDLSKRISKQFLTTGLILIFHFVLIFIVTKKNGF